MKRYKNVHQALIEYDLKGREMKFKLRCGLINEEEYAAYLLDETTLWKIMNSL